MMRVDQKFNRVVITGLGVVSPIGIGLDRFWQALQEGKSGIKQVTTFDVSKYRCKVGGEILDFDPLKYIEKSKIERMDRFAQFGIAGGRMALEDSQLSENDISENLGIYIGCSIGGMLFGEEMLLSFMEKGPRAISPASLSKIMPSSVTGSMAVELKIRGPNITISTACSSSLHAIGLAFERIRMGHSKIILTGGTETPVIPVIFGTFDAMRIMSIASNNTPTTACKPFDLNRDGLVLGEGAAILVVEELAHAINRKAKIYAEVAGYGSNSGAYHMVAPEPNGKDLIGVMSEALSDARLEPIDIDFINAHGTATQSNDWAEACAIKSLFEKCISDVAVTATKSMIGHTVGAAGAFGVIASLLAISKNIIHPTVNFSMPDPKCDINVISNVAVNKEVDIAMVNAFGFGSNNASLIIRKYQP